MKTITLKEAYDRATKGKLSADDDMISVEDQADMVKDNIGSDREWQSVGIHDEEGMAEIVALCHPINAPILAHAFNVLPETHSALEELFNDWITLVGEDLKENNADVARIWKRCEDAIAKSNQVQIP